MIQNIKDLNACPDCASTNIIHSMTRDQVICRDCGLIFEPLAPTSIERQYEHAHEIKNKKTTKTTKKTAKKKVKKSSKKKKR